MSMSFIRPANGSLSVGRPPVCCLLLSSLETCPFACWTLHQSGCRGVSSLYGDSSVLEKGREEPVPAGARLLRALCPLAPRLGYLI